MVQACTRLIRPQARDRIRTSYRAGRANAPQHRIKLREDVIRRRSVTMTGQATGGLGQLVGLRLNFSVLVGEVIETPAAAKSAAVFDGYLDAHEILFVGSAQRRIVFFPCR